MEHLDNDMDDLFQKAGELYPLKISGSDWEGVAAKLQDKNFGDLNAEPGLSGGVRNKRRWRLLLLLIPLVLGGLIYTSGLIRQKHAGSVPDNAEQIPATVNPELNTKTLNPSESTANSSGARTGQAPALPGYSSTTLGRTNNTARVAKLQTNTYSRPANGKSGMDKNSAQGSYQQAANQSVITSDAASNISEGKTKSDQQPNTNPVAPAAAAQTETVADLNKTTQVETSKVVNADTVPSVKKPDPLKKSVKGFYAGIVLGPDLSTVHSQSVHQMGFSLGATAGYRFNKRLAVETGLLWDKKYYYSKGEYFKNSNFTVPAKADVNGSCNMLEIPLDLRYDFALANNHSFFAKAGLSSYLFMRDSYSFKTMNYPEFNKSYNAPSNVFSILQLSAGYERTIGGNTNIRVEPYVKIPLQGVGTGDMPISSVGIYFGITHSFR